MCSFRLTIFDCRSNKENHSLFLSVYELMKNVHERGRAVIWGYNVWVVVGMLVVSLILGIANNFRVYDERRVPFWGWILAGEDMEGDDAADLEVEEDDAP